MKKIFAIVALSLMSYNLYATNMKTVGSIKYGSNDNYTITVKANESTVMFYTFRNHIALDYNDRMLFLNMIDSHIELYDKAQETDIDYVRTTGQMSISGNIKIVFGFYYDKDTKKSAMRMYISYASGERIEYVDLDKSKMLELKSLIENSVEDRDSLTEKINSLNSIVEKIRHS